MDKKFKKTLLEYIKNNYNNTQLIGIQNESEFNSEKNTIIELIKSGTKLYSATILTESGEELTSRGIVIKSEKQQPNLTLIQKIFGYCIYTPDGIFLPIEIKEKETLDKLLSKTKGSLSNIESATDVGHRRIFVETFDELSDNPMMLTFIGGILAGKIIAKTSFQLTNITSKGLRTVVDKIEKIRTNIADKKDGDEFELTIEKVKNFSFSEYLDLNQNTNYQKLKIRM